LIALGIGIVVVALVLSLVVVIALDPGPTPGDVAIAYEQAWDRLDFDAIWTMSGRELRDSQSRGDFLAAKERAYAGRPALSALADAVEIDEELVGSELAVVHTRLALADGASVRNQIELAFRDGGWKVIGYHLQGDPPAPPSSN
jgi:hypothetical protein